MNHIWKTILHTAVAGTDRQPLPDDVARFLHIAPELTGPQAAVQALATANLLRKAGHMLAEAPDPLPPPCSPEKSPLCRKSAVHILLNMLDQALFQEALPEFFDLLGRSGKHLPPEIIPPVLNFFARQKSLPHSVPAALGPTGAWLARQHPHWAPLYTPDEPDWDTGRFSERLHLLYAARRKHPLVGLAWLEKTWSGERAEHRLQFLEALRTALSMADEPLLEQALTDRSRPVRTLAVRLLMQLPDSRLRRDARDFLTRLQHHPATTERLHDLLEAILPENGIFSRIHLAGLQPGRRTVPGPVSPATTLIALLHPDDLAQATEMPPAALLSRLETGADNMLPAFLDNIAWYADPDWLQEAVRFAEKHPDNPIWTSDALASVLQALPEPLWQQWMPALSNRHRHLLELPGSALAAALNTGEYIWSKALLQSLIDYPLHSGHPRHWQPPLQLRTILHRAAYRCRPTDAEGASPADAEWPYAWQSELAQFRAVTRFRQRMWEQILS